MDNLQYVGSNAFANCRIEELPRGFLKENCSYGTRVFSECYCLKYVYIPPYFKINESGFECCDRLLSVDFADENSEIHKKMFKNCLLLQKINLPKELSAICQEAFSGDINLKEIIYPPNLEIVQYGAFSHCANLEKFVPLSESNIRNIGSSAFAYCDNLTEVNINTHDLKSLGSAAFCYTAHLNKIDLSCSSLETIETNTFARSGLQEILFPKTLRNISNSAFWDNTKLESIDLSETQLTSIGVEAFHNCVRLTDVKLPYFVSTVNKHAFEFTSLNLQDLIKNCPFCEIQNDI